jgi:hydrogenase expression/formation protein HypC
MMCLGVPGQIVEIVDPELLIAVADVAGVRRKINITCIVDDAHPVAACIGDWVLIHVGFAMARIDEAEAAETMKVLTAMGELQAELAAMQHSGKAA